LIRGVKNYRRTAKKVEYKGNRDEEKNKRVFSYENTTTELISCLGVKNMYPGILEADDVIYWLCKNNDQPKVIVSVDQDMLQLVDEKTQVYSPIKDVMITDENFVQHTNVPREQFVRYKSLMGDKSDNLPGLDKCGPKTAVKLIDKHPTDETLIEEIGAERLEPYFMNLKLIDLSQGEKHHPEDNELYREQYEKLKHHEPDFEQFTQRCAALNMNNIVSKIDDWKSTFTNNNINDRLESIVNSLNLHK
jgi:DNA polymerase-1